MKRSALLFPSTLLLQATASLAATGQGEEKLTLQNSPQQSVQQNNTLRDIHGPLPTSDYPPYLVEAAVVLLVIAILTCLYFFFKKRQKPLPPPIPPWDRALGQLAEARQLIIDGRSLLYMERAAQILRSYIESRFAIPSTRQTTAEFFAALKASETPDLMHYQVELRHCLEQADMAKFAHLISDRDHLEQMEGAVQAFINRTRPEMPVGDKR